jgi:outer membrane murein-binding lipoprotein Lpp
MTFRIDRTGMYALAAFGAALLLTSCTCKIKEEQQAMINQLRTSEKQLQADLKKAEGDKAKIAQEVSARQGEVRRCNEKKAFVSDKLAKFPDVWPGWDPNPPAPVEEPAVEKSTTKKKK